MNNNEIKKIALISGADVCGIASIERFSNAPSGFHPSDIYKDTKSVIVFARQFPKGAVCTGNKMQYSISEDIVTDQIRHITYNFSLLLQEKGITAVPVYTEPYTFWDNKTKTGKGDLSLKHAGYLAGLGVFGKNHLLYNYKYGNMIKLGAILSDHYTEQDEIASYSFCKESCLLCMKNCPSAAIEDNTVIQDKCRSMSEGQSLKGHSITVCNVCRTICPYCYGLK